MSRLASRCLAFAALALAGATALAACGGSGGGTTQLGPQGAFGTAPPASGTPHTGTFKVAFGPGATPTWIFPITPGANGSVYTSYQFQYEMWRPVYWYVNGVQPVETPGMSLANAPKWSNGNKTVTFTLKSWKWSDGQPITSKDVAFFIDLVKAAIKESAANWSQYTPKLGIPDAVTSVSTPNDSTVAINLNAPVNPTWFAEDSLGTVIPLPSHAWAKASANGPTLDFTNPANAKKIYDFIAAQSKDTKSYASNPLWQVVDGPYKLTSFNNTTGAFAMTPNTAYSGPTLAGGTAKMSKLQAVPFTSDTAEFNAVKSGAVDWGYIPLPDLPQLSSVKTQYNVFGYPAFGFNYVTYNFKDTTGDFNNIIKQLYIRQAMAHLEDENGYIKAFFHGAGGPGYGPVPKIPATPYTPANAETAPYPFSVSAAASLLKAHGWTVNPGGTSVCSDASKCGAGIPAGTKLAWNLIYNSGTQIITQQVTDLVSQAKKVGINITLKSDNFNHMIATYYDLASPKTINDWAMEDFGGFSISSYPTMNGIFNSDGTYNIGAYSDPHADALIKASTTSSDPSAVKNEAAYLTQQQPSLFQPNVDNVVAAWKKSVSGEPESFESTTQFQLNPEFWYFTK